MLVVNFREQNPEENVADTNTSKMAEPTIGDVQDRMKSIKADEGPPRRATVELRPEVVENCQRVEQYM